MEGNDTSLEGNDTSLEGNDTKMIHIFLPNYFFQTLLLIMM